MSQRGYIYVKDNDGLWELVHHFIITSNYRGRAHFLHAQVAEVNALELVNKMLSLGDAVIAWIIMFVNFYQTFVEAWIKL